MDKKRNKSIEFRVTQEEKELIEKYASKLGLSTSRYIRNLVLLEMDSFFVKSGMDEKLIKSAIYIKKKLHEPMIEERLKED
jgi:hypothetical protein